MDSDVPKQVMHPPRTTARCCHAAAVAVQAFLSMCGVLFLLSLLEFDLDLRHTTCITDVSGRAARQRERPYAERDDAVGLTVVYDVEERLERAWSRWQTGEVFSTQFFGNVLLLDNEVMITEHDEEHYHEMMAQVPLAYRPQVREAQRHSVPPRLSYSSLCLGSPLSLAIWLQATHGLVIGGGDGGTLRQFLKNPVSSFLNVAGSGAGRGCAGLTYFTFVLLCPALLRKNIESVTMVEIDEMVVELSRRHFPQMARAFA